MNTEAFKRKLTAILSADVKGYSRLMGEDEDATIRTLTTYRELMFTLIQKHRGRVVDSPGDNLLAEFGSIVDAVRCAVEIQEELRVRNAELPENRKMKFRIGINLGDVVEEGERIYGDGVNIAARIENLAEGGGICISGTVYDSIEGKLELEFEYLGEHEVKNIDKPIRVYRVLSFPEAAAHRVVQGKSATERKWRRVFLAMTAIIVLGGTALAIWNFYLRPSPPSFEPAVVEKMAFPLPDQPSIAVLPFVNMSGDPKQEYIADGITENIIAALSNISDMFVIARNSTFTYKGKPVKVQRVSEELGVRYVLEGSVQKAGNRLRVTAQLIDAIKGHHLWAKRYNRNIDDLFTLQDEITQKVVVELQVELMNGEGARKRHTTNKLEAWEYAVKASSLFERYRKEDNAKARDLFEEALEIDPEYAFAWTMLAWTYFIDAWFGFSESRPESIKRSFELAKKAAALDDTLPEVHSLWNTIYLIQGQHDKAISEGERAIALGPNNSLSYILLAQTMAYAGRPEEAITLAKQAIRLSPYYSAWYLYRLGESYQMAGRYEEALETYKGLLARSQKGDFDPGGAHLCLAEVYIQLGREEEARAHTAQVLRLYPDFSLELWKKWHFYKDPSHLERRLDALRKAGLPAKPPLPLPDKPSIAVLPFTNLSDDPKQEYFADGMTDDLITDLSKISGLFVIARNSAFQYQGKPVDVKRISRELGVRYLLEGSVRRAKNQVRINAQLIDATTGGHLWAERYDREFKEIFSLQDEVTEQIVKALAVKLLAGEKERILKKDTANPEAYDLALRAWVYFQKYSKEKNAIAKNLFEKAIELDPSYASAQIGLVWTMLIEWHLGWNQDPQVIDRAFELAEKIVAQNEFYPKAHELLGSVYLWEKSHDEAIAAFERAITLDPNDADAIQSLASVMNFVGKPEEAIVLLKKAIRLNPHYPTRYIFNLGRAYFQAGRYDQAISALKEAIIKNPHFPPVHYYLAASYGNLGNLESAREKAGEIKRIRPNFKSEIEKEKSFYKYKKDLKSFVEGLRKAGLT
jgi:TolB-like protein/class 3 adenylate cyclase/cytochrome c-type biogenesis protein CcmH/NrfG